MLARLSVPLTRLPAAREDGLGIELSRQDLARRREKRPALGQRGFIAAESGAAYGGSQRLPQRVRELVGVAEAINDAHQGKELLIGRLPAVLNSGGGFGDDIKIKS